MATPRKSTVRLAYIAGDVSLAEPHGRPGHRPADDSKVVGIGLDAMPPRDLRPRSTKKARSYSKGKQAEGRPHCGTRHRRGFSCWMNRLGLDPLKGRGVPGVCASYGDDGRTVLLSSHILSEAEALSDRVSIIRDGKVVESDRPHSIASPHPNLDHG